MFLGLTAAWIRRVMSKHYNHHRLIQCDDEMSLESSPCSAKRLDKRVVLWTSRFNSEGRKLAAKRLLVESDWYKEAKLAAYAISKRSSFHKQSACSMHVLNLEDEALRCSLVQSAVSSRK
jgi:hypothetical protein